MSKNTKQVLIVEQHRHHGEAIYMDIRGIFDHYHVAGSAAEAKALIERHEFDMLIVNPFLPDSSGRNFIRSLKENMKTQTIPIIVVAGMPGKDVKLEFYAAGADAYFELPYDKETFRAAVEKKLVRHFRLLMDGQGDIGPNFVTRSEFETSCKERLRLKSGEGKKLTLGIAAPIGIDFVIRDYGLEMGSRLITNIAQLMEKMCHQQFRATMWTQKSIVFAVEDMNIHEVKQGFESIRLRYLEMIGDIPKLQDSPGIRVVLDEFRPEMEMNQFIDRLITQLIRMTRHNEKETIQIYQDVLPQKHHVLVADSDPVSMNIIKHRLGKDKYHVDEISDTESLKKYPAIGDTSAILIDSLVPGGGIEMVREIHSDPALKNIPLMLLSRYGHEEEIAEAFEAGVRDYLMKPFSPLELSVRLKRMTD
jgi:two-component system, cell cycle response regulator